MTTDVEPSSNSKELSSSISSLPSSKRQSSEISKIYKCASQLFLTRRFSEAHSTLKPLVTPPSQPSGRRGCDDEWISEAPIARAIKSQRIKLWVLYITLLNSIVDLGRDEGKKQFGDAKYKAIVNSVQSGDIWETVVRDGYDGREGSVDAEVVYNLATLLLGQAPSQSVTQSRLESFLASSSLHVYLDARSHPDQEFSRREQIHVNGVETPKDLKSQLDILELFTLHVLPRNGEWEYARTFLSTSDMLDDERRESFLQSLQEIQNVRDLEAQEEVAAFQQQDAGEQEQLEERNHPEAEHPLIPRRLSQQNSPLHRRTNSEIDYGIEAGRMNGNALTRPKAEQSPKVSNVADSTRARVSHLSLPARSSRNQSVRTPPRQPTSYSQRAKNLLQMTHRLVRGLASSLATNPTTLFKVLLSILAIIMAFGRRDVRERAQRALTKGWGKIKNTVGMGVKVSYI